MRMRNILLSAALCSTLIALPSLASAKDLYVANDTKIPFSISVNNHCSSVFGFVQPKQGRKVSESILKKLCANNKAHCKAEIHQSRHCSGKMIATFMFDVKTGLSGKYTSVDPYKVKEYPPVNTFVLYE